MNIVLPIGWVELCEAENPTIIAYQKMYPDGVDVLLTIEHRNNAYELYSSVEHRCSRAAKNMDSVHQNMESAIKAAVDEMVAWDSEKYL